jgi:hypothetical protein
MKRVLVFFMILFFYSAFTKLQAQEIISLFDDKVSFEKYDNDKVIYTKTWNGSWRGKIRILTGIIDEEYLSTAEKDGLSPGLLQLIMQKNGRLYNSDLINLLKFNQPFALTQYNDKFLDQSYSIILYNDNIIGETFFSTNNVEAHWPASFGYTISLIVEDAIISIDIWFVDSECIIPNELPEFFNIIDGKYYWKDENAIEQFYRQINTAGNTMPESIQLLYETYHLIMKTLEIK